MSEVEKSMMPFQYENDRDYIEAKNNVLKLRALVDSSMKKVGVENLNEVIERIPKLKIRFEEISG